MLLTNLLLHHAVGHDRRGTAQHDCINLRLPHSVGSIPGSSRRRGRALNVRVKGCLTFNNARLILQAAEAARRLACVLADWCRPFSGFHLY